MKRLILLALLSATISGTALAQFPKIPRPNKEKVADETKGMKKAPLDYSSPYPPAPVFESLLNRLDVKPNGNLSFNGFLRFAFLPLHEEGRSEKVTYGSHPSQHSLTMKLRKSTGEVIDNNYYFTAYQESGSEVFWVTQRTPLANVSGEGDYTLEFYIDDKLFYKYPFKVKKEAGSDPYNPQPTYYSEGAWNDYGFFTLEGTDKLVRWNLFLNKSHTVGDDNAVRVKVQILKGGKVIAENDENLDLTRVANYSWVPRKYVLSKPGRLPFSIKDMADGQYEAVVTINGKKQIHPFAVKGGEFQLMGRQDRSTEATQLIEGGGTSWFYIRKNPLFE